MRFVSVVEQELFTLADHLSSLTVYSEVHVTSGAGTVYPSGPPEFTHVYSRVNVTSGAGTIYPSGPPEFTHGL